MCFNPTFTPICLYSDEQNLIHSSAKKLKFNYLLLSHIIEATLILFILLLTSLVPIVHIFCLKYNLSDPLIPSVFLLSCPVSLIYLYINTLYVNDNTDNIHNSFSHMYCLIHTSVLSYIIPSFMKTFPRTSSEWKFSYDHM